MIVMDEWIGPNDLVSQNRSSPNVRLSTRLGLQCRSAALPAGRSSARRAANPDPSAPSTPRGATAPVLRRRSPYNRCVRRRLYKYIPHQHAGPFVQRGEVLFRSLLYFLASEDARADELEGTHEYAPVSGLKITDHTQGWKRTVPGSSFRSSVKDPDKLFCTSQAFERDLACIIREGPDSTAERA